MKYLILIASAFTALVVLGSCATLSPIPDPKLAPAKAGVYNMEVDACGVKSISGGACVFQKGAAPAGSVVIRAPLTNTVHKPAKLELLSPECNYSDVRLVAPGQTTAISVADVVKTGASCSLQIVMSPVWDRQASLTFPTEPLKGRVLLLTLDHPPTRVSPYTPDPFPVLGFTSVDQVLDSSSARIVVVDTQGSAFGQVLLEGCGMDGPIRYSTVDPTLFIPATQNSCILFGTVQRLDTPGSLSFAVAVNKIPGAYEPLADPEVVSEVEGQSDPAVSSIDFGSFAVSGGHYRVSKKHAKMLGSEYDVRQITTGGRFSISHIRDGKITWSLR